MYNQLEKESRGLRANKQREMVLRTVMMSKGSQLL
jgi:hypothetical protein